MGCEEQRFKPVGLLRREVVDHVAHHRLAVTEQQDPARRLLRFIEYPILPADGPMPVRRQLEGELSQRCIEDLERWQMIHGDAYDLYPQSLEVPVPLPEQHKLLRSDRGEGHGEEGEQERLSL